MEHKGWDQGFGLIEVMIALFIISIGALGYTRAQFLALQTASDSGLRTTAAILVEDMVSRMEANAAETLQGLNSGYQTGPATLSNNCLSSIGNICTSNEMALHDLADWQAAIISSFPAGSGAIGIVCLDQSPGNSANACTPPSATPSPVIFTVKILWNSWKSRGSITLDQSIVATVMPPLQR